MKKRGIEVLFSQNEKDSIFTDFSQAKKYLLDGFLVKVRLAELTRVFKPEENFWIWRTSQNNDRRKINLCTNL